MKKLLVPVSRLCPVAIWFAAFTASSQVFINEILFNPPGPDAPNEYIELRGTPNLVLSAGTYFLSVEGDTNGNPGTVQNVFDLSGRAIGGNGFLVLLQKTNSYTVNSNATVLVNTNGGGWGSGSSSSIGHRGENGQTDLEQPAATFFLIQSSAPPSIGSDIDSDNDGVPDGPMFASWTVLDSVGVLDSDGLGDMAYGLINFRRNPAAIASGTIVSVSFTPSYIGRNGNTTGWAASDWVASDNLNGTAPNWSLGSSASTVPAGQAGAALNHIGGPNFGAPALPGVIITQSGGSTDVVEGGATDSYTIALNTPAGGTVVIQITANSQVQVSTDGGMTFGSSRTLSFTDTLPKTVTVRAVDDNVVEPSPHPGRITHALTSGTASYPVTSLIPALEVNITDNEFVLLSELKVNPPGPGDDPYEFIELRGTPGASLSNIYLLVIEGNSGNNPGTANMVVSLTNARLGSNGLLLIVANGHPYNVPADTTVILDSRLNTPGGGLENGTISFLLVSSPSPIMEGEDLDAGNNGKLEELPDGTVLLDAVAWSDGGPNDVTYGGVVLTQTSGTPDAATRFPSNNVPRSASAWFNGNLAGASGDSLAYDASSASANFPAGTRLTPGTYNNTAPTVSSLAAICGTIGDPTNPEVNFTVNDAESSPGTLLVTASSSDPSVAPNANLIITAGTGGARTLRIDPVGVGYATITVTISDGGMTNETTFPYAASAMGRPGGRFHIGSSDGSTAIPIDSEWMFVGDDENQVLRIFNRHQSGLPVWQMDFTPFLGLPDIESGLPREVDIEGSTRVGNRLFWIGSHSHAEIGEFRTNRTRIFATDIAGSGAASTLAYAGRYDYLKLDLINWDSNNGHGKGANYYGLAASDADGVPPKAPDGSGFNIEGLAMAPGSSSAAYVCFRAPIVPATNRNYALIVPVLNFTNVAVSGGQPGSAVFGAPIELDLYGRGIRSIEGNANGYLISAGPAGDTNSISNLQSPISNLPHDFKLYTWTGNPTDLPQQRSADLSGLNPEGIVELPPAPWTADSQVQLISDSGRTVWYGDGVAAKHLTERNFKKFRSDVVTLGTVVKPAPVITAIRMSDGGMLIQWRALKGETYRVQYAPDVASGVWTDVSGDVTATGPSASKVVSVAVTTARFYRVVLLP